MFRDKNISKQYKTGKPMKKLVFNKKFFINLAKVLALTGMTLLVVLVGVTVSTVWELQIKLESSEIKPAFYAPKKEDLLEAGSSILKEDWEGFSTFLVEDISADSFSTQKRTLFLNKDIQVSSLIANHCDRVYCIQYEKVFNEIPLNIWQALVGIEDLRFLQHRGVDPIAIARALVVDIVSMRFVQGGSTITQQLVKNLFLTSERTLNRKFKEVIYALYIENLLGKEKILSLYLNEVFWGTFQGIYLKGFYSASLAYFNKKPDMLTTFEATILISMLKGPNYYRPDKNLERLKSRVEAVFKRLKENNIFSPSEEKWDQKTWIAWQTEYIQRSKGKNFRLYYRLSLDTGEALGSFDLYVLQKTINSNLTKFKEKWPNEDIAVKLIIGHKNCTDQNCPRMYQYYSKIERDLKLAIKEERHQVGSLLKPLVYDFFIDHGKKWDDMVGTSPITLNLKSGKWRPKDYSKVKVEEVSLQTALQKSKNIPLIRLSEEMGFDKVELMLEKYIPNLKRPLGEYPAQLLGAVEMSLGEVFEMYQDFLSIKCEEVLNQKTTFEQSVIYLMSRAKETTISKIVDPKLEYSYLFGKTGTSNLGHDNWYIAFDGNWIYAIWVGVDSNRTDKELYFTGASTSYRIFQQYLLGRGKLIPEVFCN